MHDLRHASATLMCWPVASRSRWRVRLGNSTIRVTAHLCHVAAPLDTIAAERLGRALPTEPQSDHKTMNPRSDGLERGAFTLVEAVDLGGLEPLTSSTRMSGAKGDVGRKRRRHRNRP